MYKVSRRPHCIFAIACLALATPLSASTDVTPPKRIEDLLCLWEKNSEWIRDSSFSTQKRLDRTDRDGVHTHEIKFTETSEAPDGSLDLVMRSWSDVAPPFTKPDVNSGIELHYVFSQNLCDGKLLCAVRYKPLAKIPTSPAIVIESTSELPSLRVLDCAGVDGYLLALTSNVPDWDVIRNNRALTAKTLSSVRQSSATTKLEAKTSFGTIDVEFDPSHGFNPSNLHLFRAIGDLVAPNVRLPIKGFDRHGMPTGSTVAQEVWVDDMKYEKFGSRWIITAFHTRTQETFTDNSRPLLIDSVCSRTNIVLCPHAQVATPFTLAVPDGTRVDIPAEQGNLRSWSRGKIYDLFDKNVSKIADPQDIMLR